MKHKLLTLILLLFSVSAFSSRTVISLDRGWQFTPSWQVHKLVEGEVVNLPHTYNLDALAGLPNYFRGMVSYLRSFDIPKEWQDSRRVYLRFGGANQTADVYVNSKHVGTHKGGYTAFGFDVTSWLNFGSSNTVWVRLSNALDLDVMPLVGDLNHYGGLYRSVELISVPKMHISPTDFGSSGVYVSSTRTTETSASVNVRAIVAGTPGTMGDVRFYVRDENGIVLDSVINRIKIGSEGVQNATAMFHIEEPHLWQSVQDPYLYQADVLVLSIDKSKKEFTVAKDSISTPFGLRLFEVDAQNRFLLNGKPFRIQGVARHQDWAMFGNALYREHHRRDVELMREMGVNAVRLANGPHDPYFIELCDRAGILVWCDLPFIGPGAFRDKGYNDTEAFRENGEQQLTEMIRQGYNHPSIFAWGLFNSLTQRGDDPLAYLKQLHQLAKAEDPSRLTVGASNQDGAINFVTDLIGFNMVLGWESGLPSDIGLWGAGVRRDFPRLKVGLSEYGAGASIYHHTDSLVRPLPELAWHPEEWQAHLHEQYWRTIASKDYFWGSFVWSMFDYGAAHRNDGDRKGVSDRGLVTFDRRVCKDAFYFYKANWNRSEPFVYIAGRRFEERANPTQTFTVYSTCSHVQLVINGQALTQLPSDGFGTFVWKNCLLKPGINTIEAISGEGLIDAYQVRVL